MGSLAATRPVAGSPAGLPGAIEIDAQGTATVPIDAPGVWRAEFHHAAVLVGDPEADWALYTATLVFEAPAPVPGGHP